MQRVDLHLSVSAEHQEDYILFHIKENYAGFHVFLCKDGSNL